MEQSIKITITSVAIASDGAVFTDAEECAAYERMLAAVASYNNTYGYKRGEIRIAKHTPMGRYFSAYHTYLHDYKPKDV